METKKFSINEALHFGWNTMKANIGFFLGIVVLSWIIVGVPSGLAAVLQEDAPGISFLFRLISWVVSAIIQIGIIRIALKFIDKEKPEINDLFNSFKPCFWRFLGASILYGLIVFGGMLLLIVPGIYWAVKFQYFGYLIVDQNLGVMDSLKKSSAVTNGIKWPLFGFSLLLMLINYLGVVALFIGLLVTIPITMIAYASVYRILQIQHDSSLISEVPKQPAEPNV